MSGRYRHINSMTCDSDITCRRLSGSSLAVSLSVALALLTAMADGDSQHLKDFVARTDNSANPFIVSLIESADLQRSVEIVEALGSRRDEYLADIVIALLSGAPIRDEHEVEHLLRVLLVSFLPLSAHKDVLVRRIALNREMIRTLVLNLTNFRDPMLRRHLLLLLPRFDSPSASATVLRMGGELIQRLTRSGGHIGANEIAEILAYVNVGRGIGGPVLAEQFVTIAELAEDRSVVQAARSAAMESLSTFSE